MFVFLQCLLNICRKFEFSISQGSVATRLRCDGYCCMAFVANFIRFAAVQKFWKSGKISQSCRVFKGGNFFLRHSVESEVVQCGDVTVAVAQQCPRDSRKLSVKALKVAINKHLQASNVDFVKCRLYGMFYLAFCQWWAPNYFSTLCHKKVPTLNSL